MSSIQERLQMKREPLDKWSVREQLCLASAVARSGDQNWMSVSRALKPFGDPNRPSDWFHQKNCAAQYGALLGNVETPKRKKRTSGVDSGIETPGENILRRLLAERQGELKKLLAEEKSEYLKLQEELTMLQSGKVSEDQLDKWCKEIDDEENKKEQESIVHAQWLKERELRKQEIERAWRPTKPTHPISGLKRKNSDSIDSLLEGEHLDEPSTPSQESQPKPALSPLLTSLLKSPSQVQNVATSSILHSAITNQRPINTNSTSPMIASLLNSSTSVAVSPGLQQLVTTAIGQEPGNIEEQSQPLGNDILGDANLPNLKIDDLASSILVQDGPLPEIKKEEVDDIISEIIENAHDIVNDPEQHLQLDGNGDININLELDDFEEDDAQVAIECEVKEAIKEAVKETPKVVEKSAAPNIDPFEFQEDPVIFEPPKPSTSIKPDSKHIPQYQQQQPVVSTVQIQHDHAKEIVEPEILEPEVKIPEKNDNEIKKEIIEEPAAPEKCLIVEAVDVDNVIKEVVENIKETSKPQESEIVHPVKLEPDDEPEEEKPLVQQLKITEETSHPENNYKPPETKDAIVTEESSEASDVDTKPLIEIKKEVNINIDVQENAHQTTTILPDFTEELYDDITMEVKVDKSGKAKRDYSRTKKKEEKGFDVLLSIEKSHLEDDLTEETLSDKELQDVDKKDIKKLKTENDRSNSPWTEEEDNLSNSRNKRRYSTPATPSDSVPNSPASSVVFYDDDREFRNWKKSVMLVYNRLATNKYASLFLKPITDDQAPGYNNIVYRPIDLLSIKKNIETGTIRTTLEFKRDIMLMFNNAIMYNKTNGTVYNMAKQMQQESLQPIEILMQAHSHVDGPLRRETRTSESGTKRKRTTTTMSEETAKKKRKED